jgi:hypothetical protein
MMASEEQGVRHVLLIEWAVWQAPLACSTRNRLRRLGLGELHMSVGLHALPQPPGAQPALEALHILGFLALSEVGCPPLAARYRVRPEPGGAAGDELPPLFACLLNHLLGGALLAEARSAGGRSAAGAAPTEPGEPSAAVVRAADGRLGCGAARAGHSPAVLSFAAA